VAAITDLKVATVVAAAATQAMLLAIAVRKAIIQIQVMAAALLMMSITTVPMINATAMMQQEFIA